MEKSNELSEFVKTVDQNKKKLSRQEYRTIKGQALHGNVFAANRGMKNVMRRRGRRRANIQGR